MAYTKLRPAILIVSDTAARDPSTDKASSVLCETFASDGGDRWETPVVNIIPDNVLDIQRHILLWTEGQNYFNVVVTTGGTDFSTKDNTPEVSGFHDPSQFRLHVQIYLFVAFYSPMCIILSSLESYTPILIMPVGSISAHSSKRSRTCVGLPSPLSP